MILRDIFIGPSREDFSNDYRYGFSLKSKHVLNYIERNCLKKIKYRIEGFNRIVFSLSTKLPLRETYVNSEKVLVVYSLFDKEKYDSLKENEISNYFSNLALTLFENLNSKIALPFEEIKHSIDTLKLANFENKWIHKKKLNRKLGLYFLLECELEINQFHLFLKIQNKTDTLLVKQLLKLSPDEIDYNYRFKDILFEEKKLVLNSKIYDENLLEILYSKLLKELPKNYKQ
jgi:hypothetical protein